MTIVGAIKKTLESVNRPLTHKEIYEQIIENQFYFFGAKDPISLVRNKIRKHCIDLDFPSASPRKLFSIAKQTSGDSLVRYTLWNGVIPGPEKTTKTNTSKDLTSEEVLFSSHKEHISSIKNQLLDCIKSSDPSFFERIVVDLLLKMGYGWDSSLAAQVTGGRGDEGIDGVIYEDKLGLEKIYIQAKRYKLNSVTPSEIRDFIGAMSVKGARKGVFFTSSDFTTQATKHASQAQGMNITLINGSLLCDYLVQHEMGIERIFTYPVYEIDRNFFSDD
ncbi:restriction endonuclease [Pseudomonas sp. 8209]|uniref:restriction endonuclease n=1 Tax=Pseudomonas sp. 8209 TaxID=2967214 RepID=UPI002363A63E|nr:restriction endonuclease [Pseudomonas sp. 8209]MDD1956922.1 restriction endonuclease [Pseudomonas sp. 8209]